MARTIPIAIGATLTLALTSCATIIGEPVQTLPLTSDPTGATVVITDETGAEVYEGTTPTSVSLEKSDGSYFGGKSYSVRLSLSGYEPVQTEVDTQANGWYIGGNILFGGLIGWLVVDPLNGDMYRLSSESIDQTLTPTSDDTSMRKGEALNIATLQSVPEALRGALEKIE